MKGIVTELLIYSVCTQVVVQKETYHVNRRVAHPAGSVGVIVRSPIDRTHTYRVKFNDGFEAAVHHDQLIRLSEFKRDPIRGSGESSMIDLNERVIYRCVIGSRSSCSRLRSMKSSSRLRLSGRFQR